MDKYSVVKPGLKSRTELNSELYQNNEIDSYNKIDLNSNVSILNTDAQNIDVDLIREMLDKKYRDNIPKRKSIAIEMDDEEIYKEKINTKEYDINEILAKAKTEQDIDYNKERLKKLRNTNYHILQNLDLDTDKKEEEYNSENELMTLINTITKLELDNQEKANREAEDLLDLGDTTSTMQPIENKTIENSFYTGNLSVSNKDFEDFKDIQNDIKSNSILIKILVTIFILILLALIIFFLNKHFNWGLF